MEQPSVTSISPNQSVASIVLAHSECAPLFQRLRIDFCCKGEQSLQTACTARQLSVAEVVDELASAIGQRTARPAMTPASLGNAELVNHIVTTHHEYLRKTLPFVSALARKVARVHGERNPKLVTVNELVARIEAELLPHLAEEEETLFPSLLAATRDPAAIVADLERMRSEHSSVGALLERLREETEDFSTPEWACTSYRTLFAELKQLEFDTLCHVHLENHVLAPRFA